MRVRVRLAGPRLVRGRVGARARAWVGARVRAKVRARVMVGARVTVGVRARRAAPLLCASMTAATACSAVSMPARSPG